MVSRKKILVVCIFPAFLVGGILVGYWGGKLLTALSDTNPYDDFVFDREVWLANTGNDGKDNPRRGMVYGLVDVVLGSQMTRDQVLQLLGEPDYMKTEYGSDGSGESEQVGGEPWEKYFLGVEWFAWDDVYSLDIYFDSSDIVSRIEVVDHEKADLYVTPEVIALLENGRVIKKHLGR
jgi:hypothetical protein